jgi:hypothetical protein
LLIVEHGPINSVEEGVRLDRAGSDPRLELLKALASSEAPVLV